MEPKPTHFFVNPQKLKSQAIFEYKQYRIPFPFEPYQVQKTFMATMIDSLEESSNALLESPTGTGKTLCLLSAALTWLEERKKTVPTAKIIYASRTHSQLRQVAKELKNTCFQPQMLTASSRDHSCINQQLKFLRGHAKEVECRKRIKGEVATCEYSNIKRAVSKYSVMPIPVGDLEEFKELGVKEGFCPFLLARSEDILNEVDLVLMPYNYIMDRNVVGIYSSILENAVVIIDEAHNIPNTACEGASMTLPLTMLESAREEVEKCQKKFRLGKGCQSLSDLDFNSLLKFLLNLQEGLERQSEELERTRVHNRLDSGEAIVREFMRFTKFGEQRRLFAEYLNGFTRIGVILMNEMNEEYLWQFDKTCGFIMLLSEIMAQESTLSRYRLCSRVEPNSSEYQLWCIDPSVAFSRLKQMKVTNLVLSSGTLAPLPSWQSELKIPFKFCLSNSHVINQSQVLMSVVEYGSSNNKFIFNYANRDNDRLNQDICGSIVKLARVVPNGMVVFFPSNVVMEMLVKFMHRTNRMEELMKVKHFFAEPRSGDAMFQDMFHEYKEKACTKRGAVLFAVCRSRISEGIDLSDELCRAAVVVGVPYPPIKDVKVMEKKKYQTEQYNASGRDSNKAIRPINGEEWYNQQTIRAVNQAIGRTIRHKNDYGAIYLMDCRYNSTLSLKKDLPSWASSSMKVHRDFAQMIEDTLRFFDTNKELDKCVRPLVMVGLELEETKVSPVVGRKMPAKVLRKEVQFRNPQERKIVSMEEYIGRQSVSMESRGSSSSKKNTTLDQFFKKK